MATKAKLDWTNVDATKFTNKKTAALYKKFREALDTMKEAQGAFDGSLAAYIAKATGTDADTIVVSHRFGLGYAIDAAGAKKTKRGTVSF